MKKLVLFSTLSLAALALNACGAAQPTKELKDARAAYQEASKGKAAELTPDKLLSAKQALDRAEAAFQDDPGSSQEKSLAYIAQRMAQLAEAHAGMMDAQKESQKAEQDYKDAQEELRKAAQNEASRMKEQLKESGEVTQKMKAELDAKQKALEAERAARAEIEKKLAEIAKMREDERGRIITLDGAVLFASGKSALLPAAQASLDRVANALQQQPPEKHFVVEGHTDSLGSDDANLRLSQARADSVRVYLVSRGIRSDRISAIGKGESVPIADNSSPEGRANNRRVEIVISK